MRILPRLHKFGDTLMILIVLVFYLQVWAAQNNVDVPAGGAAAALLENADFIAAVTEDMATIAKAEKLKGFEKVS
jgi:hypothetical protein